MEDSGTDSPLPIRLAILERSVRASLATYGRTLDASFLATDTVDLRLDTNTKTCPFSSRMSQTRSVNSSLRARLIPLVDPSLNSIVPSSRTPSRNGTGRQSLLTSFASSQSAISPAFDIVALNATI